MKNKPTILELKVEKERARLDDECSFCGRPMKYNNVYWVVMDADEFFGFCNECKEKHEQK